MPSTRTIARSTVIVSLLALSTLAGILAARYLAAPPARPDIEGLLWPNPRQLQEFTAIDQDGGRFGLDRLRNRWSLLFFGYTHCPDVCPVTLAVLKQVYERALAAGAAARLQVVFVTVDPERDSPAQLAEYVRYFNPAFIGLGGSEAQVQSLAGQIGIVHIRGPAAADGSYQVDHTASVFLVDPGARLVGVFSAPQQADDLYTRLQQIRSFVDASS